jgi:hypothetical protein
MRTRNLFGLLFSLAVLTLIGCGGGGDDGSSAGPTVSGVASKGLIRNGNYQAFQIFSSQIPAKSRISGTPFFSGVTDDKGNYSIPIPASMAKDGLLVKVIDGTYFDEATQADKSLATEYPQGMRAAFGSMAGVVARGDNLKVYITPFTEMAVRIASPGLDDISVNAAKIEIEHAFGLDNKGVDITRTKPLDPTVAPPAGSDDAQKAYTKALGIISQYGKDNAASGRKLTDLSDDLVAEIKVNGGVLTQSTRSRIDTSELNFDNGGNNSTGVPPVVAPVVTVTASKTTAVNDNIDSVTISATVTLSGVAVSGTEVKFAVQSGLGTLSEKSVLTNASGVAITVLKSTADGDANVVTATAGGVSVVAPTVNFANPNKPGAVTLVASPASGTTLPGGGVTLTATVTPVGASNVTANGTVVTFAITSGTGTLTAVTTTGSGGVATATLSATTANTVTVTATAGTATSSPVSVNFINQPTKAIIKLSTTGVPAGTLIGGLDVTVTLPAGLTVQKNADNTAVTGAVTGSGSAVGVGPTSNVLTPNSLRFAMATTAGFAGGEFVTIVADVAAGTSTGTVTAAYNGNVINTSVQPIAGVGLTVATVFQ